MTDIMLQGVLRMPYEMAMENEWSRRQFHDRAKQAADRIEELEVIVREALPILGRYEDCGPMGGETWQSDELMALAAKVRAALGE